VTLGVAQVLKWTSRRLGLHNLLALGLLVVIVVSMATGIASSVRGLDAMLLIAVAVAGMLAGWALAATSFAGWKASILLLVLGFVGLFLRIGQLGDELWALLQASIAFVWEVLSRLLALVLFRVPQGLAMDWAPVVAALSDLWAGISTLAIRVYEWLRMLADGEPAFDPVAAIMVWGLALWLVTVWAGWTVRRHARPLLAVAPGGVLLMATLSYKWGDTIVLLVLLGATLLLLALVAYSTRQRRWLAIGVDFPDLGSDTALAAIVLTVVLVTSAAAAPAITIQNIADFMEKFGFRQAGGAGPIGELPEAGWPAQVEKSHFGDLQYGGLPRRHLIGSGPELSERIVMRIRTGELAPRPLEIVAEPAPRYYWRGITYDVYTGRGWITRDTRIVEYEADESVDVAALEARREIHQDVNIIGDVDGLLHVAGELVTVDHDYVVAWRSPEDAFGATLESTTYRAWSLVSVASEEQLRSAGSDYPQWVRDRYLALPETVSDRVLRLARDLTATEPTPYDRALAIEAYLRNYPYNLDVPLPPVEVQDVVDYFLFDLREGYCDYYATSMVVLARAAGLPARLVIGYATGSYDPYRAVYVVTEADAHAWPEVYFPDYGWIEFEPTGGFPPIARSARQDVAVEQPDAGEAKDSSGREWEGLRRLAWLGWLVGPVLLVLVGVTWLSMDNWRLRRLKPEVAVVTLYRRLRRHGQQLAVPMWAGDTPYEFADSFAGWAAELAQKGRWGETLASVVSEVRRLVDLYVEVCYTSHRVGAIGRWHALEAWKKLRWQLWLARFFQRKLASFKGARQG
jgi:transglutaminase-like putative cysteine protease